MNLREFDYNLPERLIAQFPLKDREQARLLVLERGSGRIEHRHFRDLPGYLRPGDVLVLNNTRVFKARLRGKKRTGGKIEILLVRRNAEGWESLAANLKSLSVGERLYFGDGMEAVIRERHSGRCVLSFNRDDEVIIGQGETPLPRYIKRATVPGDDADYQTVYARHRGSIAAPTAGLHFTARLLAEIRARGIDVAEITLHVGPGTFQPIRTQEVSRHVMEAEFMEISPAAAECISSAQRVVAVGTSVVRALETAGHTSDGKMRVPPVAGPTDLFICAGHRFAAVDALITNFHLPGSTPLVLTCAFAGRKCLLEAYREAIAREYRLLSYGDAMLII